MLRLPVVMLLLFLLCPSETMNAQDEPRPRAREMGIDVGILPTGLLNAITDVEGVMVGHKTVWRGENVRTGVTVILPHRGNVFSGKSASGSLLGERFRQTCRVNPG